MEFEREYKQKVTSGHKYSPFGSCNTPWQIEEWSLQAWVEDLFKKALAQDRKKEVRERQSMGLEDVHSRRCEEWNSMWKRRTFSHWLPHQETEVRRQTGRRARRTRLLSGDNLLLCSRPHAPGVYGCAHKFVEWVVLRGDARVQWKMSGSICELHDQGQFWCMLVSPLQIRTKGRGLSAQATLCL